MARALVNLDAMIPRSDFALTGAEQAAVDRRGSIGLSELKRDSEFLPLLRKPDFQRETNHWSPEQVVSLLECFVDGDLIPSVILWHSSVHLFVIDGGHRLSVLRSWVEDDYGDGPISQLYFGLGISKEQIRIARRTRELVAARVGKFADVNARRQLPNLSDDEKRKLANIPTRALPIQWVQGNAEKAEASFFKINTEGTPLDDIEELLLRHRRRPVAVAARAVIRAGMGHKYWSDFTPENSAEIERLAGALHEILFDPETRLPIKTLDLPLGGPKGVRAALEVLIDFTLIANRDQSGKPEKLEDYTEDSDGSTTTEVLRRAKRLAGWITGNDKGSLGLHPAVYFYGPTGRHSGPMFMGTVILIGRKLSNNDTAYFKRFSRVRGKLEAILVERKDLLATILQKHISRNRAERWAKLLEAIVEALDEDVSITDEWLVEKAGLGGKILSGGAVTSSADFSEETKSQAFITTALNKAMKCAVCDGYLDPEKSMSYDHEVRKRDAGKGNIENLRFTHPFCNQAVKN